MSKPSFTIVMPVRDGADTIEAALDSLSWQTCDDFEVIVVDDESKDRSGTIARSHPVGAGVLDGDGNGTAVARNLAIAHATGRFVTFLDADDLWHPERLARLRTWLEANPDTKAINTSATVFADATDRGALRSIHSGLEEWPDLWTTATDLATDCQSLDLPEASDVVHTTLHHADVLAGPISASVTQVFEREMLISAGAFPTHARTSQDILLNLNFSRLAPIENLDDPTYFYRLRPGSAARSLGIPWPWLSGYLSSRFGGLHMTADRALGEGAPIPRDLALEDSLARSVARDGFDGTIMPLYHLLCLLYPARTDRWAIFRRIAAEVLKTQSPGIDRRLRNLRATLRSAPRPDQFRTDEKAPR